MKYKRYIKKQRKKGTQTYVRIGFRNSKIQDDLYKLGYIKSKMRSSIFPDLDNRELDLSFLLGFFDGDGKEGKNVLHIGSKKILEEIKKKFVVPHDILTDKRGYYHLSLGGKLFNSIMQNYKNSLERKRRFFRVSAKKRLKEITSKKELKDMVWKLPLKEIAKNFNTYPRALAEICDEWGIQRPATGYWLKNSNKKHN